ncbi:MAG: TonB family protein [Betaproteobacteria bacterium]
MAISAALHVYLIHGISLPASARSGARALVIEVRLESAPALPRHTRPAIVRPAPWPEPEAATVGSQVFVEQPSAAPISAIADTAPLLATSFAVEPYAAGFPDLVHYAAKELDIYPQVVAPIMPTYPPAAFAAHTAGFVTLQVMIDESGRVLGTSVVDAAPDGVFEQAARQAVTAAAFHPAQKDGRIVRSRVLVRIDFEPGSVNAAP